MEARIVLDLLLMDFRQICSQQPHTDVRVTTSQIDQISLPQVLDLLQTLPDYGSQWRIFIFLPNIRLLQRLLLLDEQQIFNIAVTIFLGLVLLFTKPLKFLIEKGEVRFLPLRIILKIKFLIDPDNHLIEAIQRPILPITNKRYLQLLGNKANTLLIDLHSNITLDLLLPLILPVLRRWKWGIGFSALDNFGVYVFTLEGLASYFGSVLVLVHLYDYKGIQCTYKWDHIKTP